MRRMQTVVEDVVADAQCGFELGCGCRSHHDNMEAEVSVTGELARLCAGSYTVFTGFQYGHAVLKR